MQYTVQYMYNVIIKQHILVWTKKEILYILLFCFPKHGISQYLLQVSRSYNIIEDSVKFHGIGEKFNVLSCRVSACWKFKFLSSIIYVANHLFWPGSLPLPLLPKRHSYIRDKTKQNNMYTHTHIILLYVCTLGSFAHIPSWLAVVIIRFLVLIIAITYQWTIWSTIIHHSQVNIPNTHTLTCTRTSMVQTVNFWPWKVS